MVWLLPAALFNPLPEPSTLAIHLVIVGVYIASSAVLSALSPLPLVVSMCGTYLQYTFYVGLLVIFLFGVGMILLGSMVADNAAIYAPLGRTMMRVSHVILVFAVALREFASKSATPANATK